MSGFATQFAKVSQAATKAAFETRFQSIQKGLIKRLNKEIGAVIDDDTARRLGELQKRRDKLADSLPKVREYQFGLNTNAYRFFEIQEDAKAAAVASDADANATLSADEVDAINTAKAEITEKIRRLQTLYYPGFADPNLVLRMKQDADALEALTAVEGTIDPSGTATPTNDNRAIIDKLNDLAARAVTFASSTNTLVETTNEMIIDTQKKLFDLEADMAQISVVEIARKNEEIEELKAKYGNILKAISISFEVSSGLADTLAEGSTYKPAPGSILNLFT